MPAFLRRDVRTPFAYTAALAFIGSGWVLISQPLDWNSRYFLMSLFAAAILAATWLFASVSRDGPDVAAMEGVTIASDMDAQAGDAVYWRAPVAVGDADAETRFSLPEVVRTRGV